MSLELHEQSYAKPSPDWPVSTHPHHDEWLDGVIARSPVIYGDQLRSHGHIPRSLQEPLQ